MTQINVGNELHNIFTERNPENGDTWNVIAKKYASPRITREIGEITFGHIPDFGGPSQPGYSFSAYLKEDISDSGYFIGAAPNLPDAISIVTRAAQQILNDRQ
jgi:hypothetical protein